MGPPHTDHRLTHMDHLSFHRFMDHQNLGQFMGHHPQDKKDLQKFMHLRHLNLLRLLHSRIHMVRLKKTGPQNHFMALPLSHMDLQNRQGQFMVPLNLYMVPQSHSMDLHRNQYSAYHQNLAMVHLLNLYTGHQSLFMDLQNPFTDLRNQYMDLQNLFMVHPSQCMVHQKDHLRLQLLQK